MSPVRGAVVAIDAVPVRPGGKGVSRVLENLVPRLVHREHPEYHVLTTADGRRILPDLPPSRCHVVPRLPGSVWEQFGVPVVASRLGADLLYLHREQAPRWGPPVLLHVPEDPRARWARGGPNSLSSDLRKAYERAFFPGSLRGAGRVVTSTRSTRRDLVGHWDLAGDGVEVVPLGVDPMFFANGDEPEWNIIFHLGSEDPRDQTELVIRGYACLAAGADSNPPELVISGGLGRLLPRVKALARRLSVEDRVRFTGRVSDEKLVQLYARARTCVQPSAHEGFGLQVVEALAAGAPLVAVDAPAVREVAGDAAVLIPESTPSALAGALERLLADPALRAECRARARQRASDFTWERTADRVHETVCSMLEG